MIRVSSLVVLVQPQEVSSLPKQDEHETLETLFKNVDLSLAEKEVHECFHTTGPGRPPRNPLGFLRAFIVMRMKAVRSLRELARILDVDPRMRRLCLIEDGERGYPRSVLSRFTRLVGAERLRRIIDEKVGMLLRRSGVKEVDTVLDASFIKAWSIRHPDDNQGGYSDPDARVGRNGRTYDLGYKHHVSVDHRLILPLADVLAPANENEKRYAPGLLDKAVEVTVGRVETLVADSQYSSKRVRGKIDDCGVMAVIPYPSNQRRDEDVLRVDRYFRVYGSEEERRLYGLGRSSIERVNSRLEGQVCLDRHRVRGLRSVAVHVALCIIAMLLVAVVALRLGAPWKARSIATFGW